MGVLEKACEEVGSVSSRIFILILEILDSAYSTESHQTLASYGHTQSRRRNSISSKGSFDDWIPCSWRSHINELHKSIAHPFPLVAVLVDLMWTLSLPDPCFYGPNHFPRELWFIKLISGKEIRSTASAEGTLGQVLDSYSCS